MARPNITNGAFALFLLGLTAGIASAQDHPGVESYNHVCGFCHGPEGRGDPAPPLVPLAYEVDYILAIVREGYGEMPPISTRELSDDQVRQVVEYLEILSRDLQRNQAKEKPVPILERREPSVPATVGRERSSSLSRPLIHQAAGSLWFQTSAGRPGQTRVT